MSASSCMTGAGAPPTRPRVHQLADERGVADQLAALLADYLQPKAKVSEGKQKNKTKSKTAQKQENKSVNRLLRAAGSPPAMLASPHTTARSPGELRLVCDNMLQGLCKKLRLFGVDCVALENGQGHGECITLAEQGRFVVSRGAPAAMLGRRLPAGHLLALTTNELEQQVEEVLAYFVVRVVEGDLFSRCILCNGAAYYLLDQAALLALHSGQGEGDVVEVEVRLGGTATRGQVDLATGKTDGGVAVAADRVPREVILATQVGRDSRTNIS